MGELVELRHSAVHALGTAEVGVALLDNSDSGAEPLTVELAVLPADGAEYGVVLRVGERAEIGGAEWAFEGADAPDTYGYVVRMRRCR